MLVAVVMSTLAGCWSQPPWPPPSRESWPFRFHSEASIPDCVVQALTEHFDRWAPRLGVVLGSDEYIDVVIVDPAGPYCRAPRGVHPEGCADERTAYVPYPVFGHEMIHTYAAAYGPKPRLRLLEEGLATLSFCDEPPSGEPSSITVDLRTVVRSADFWRLLAKAPHPLYLTSAWFVAYLVDTYGWDTFMRIFAALPEDARRIDVDRVFVRETGATFDALVARWERAPATSALEWCSRHAFGAIDTLPLDQTQPMSCGPPYEGSWAAVEGGVWSSNYGVLGRVEAGARTRFHLRVENQAGLVAQLARDSEPYAEAPLLATGFVPSAELVWDLPPGSYRLDARDGARFPTSSTDAPSYLAGSEPLGSDRCGGGALDVSTLYDLEFREFEPLESAADGVDAVLWLRDEADSAATVRLPGGREAWWCTESCQAGPPCLLVSSQPLALGGYTLQLQAGVDHALVLVRPPSGEAVSAEVSFLHPLPP